ncbi:MAG TPA: DUF6036 family nucleotidyltransferase [Vitreimonas sp.]|nr:DUF6036 family nucleotidyltransferase [Vitreimonas sp.]
MRRPVDDRRVRRFLAEIGRLAEEEGSAYLVGGATAVIEGWRPTTVDVDLRLEPEQESVLRALPRLKHELEINVELASPLDFLPELPGWRDRSPFVTREGRLTVRHFDPYSQALAKIERGHDRDVADVEAMLARGLVEPRRLRELFASIEPELYRFPAIDPAAFRRRLDEIVPGA